jgi:hypothetical protein
MIVTAWLDSTRDGSVKSTSYGGEKKKRSGPAMSTDFLFAFSFKYFFILAPKPQKSMSVYRYMRKITTKSVVQKLYYRSGSSVLHIPLTWLQSRTKAVAYRSQYDNHDLPLKSNFLLLSSFDINMKR